MYWMQRVTIHTSIDAQNEWLEKREK